MIQVGTSVYQAIFCPTCGAEIRIFKGAGTIRPTFVCRNKKCADKDVLFQVDRAQGVVTEVLPKEKTDAELGKTTESG